MDYVSKKARVSDLVLCQGGKGSIEEKMSIFQLSNDCRSWHIMHQSIPPAPSPPPPPPGNCGAFAHLVSPGGGAFANVALPGGRAFANPRANPELLTRTWFPIRI